MKKNPFAYLKNAPRIKGARKLNSSEIAQRGDRFLFLRNWGVPESLRVLSVVPPAGAGIICVGSSLETSREAWGTTGMPFDGVIYRPIPKKSST